jgi:hypothetical protein
MRTRVRSRLSCPGAADRISCNPLSARSGRVKFTHSQPNWLCGTLEMPQCYCFRGRSYFEPRSARSDWEPTADHYPRLKAHGGHLTPDNVRLAHRLCNRRDYTWRMKINALLGKRMSLKEIAEKLNAEKVPTIHGTNRWTAASVRKAFVS